MSQTEPHEALHALDISPGDDRPGRDEITHGLMGYTIGLVLAVGLTAVSFLVAGTHLVWQPSIPIALFVLAVAQIGVHLVFFLHITTGPDSTNNVMALAFGVLIVFLVIGGSLWIMGHMNANMALPMSQIMQMQR
jgi:cytochrome o ubiquinol oxidase operon protein cyoD